MANSEPTIGPPVAAGGEFRPHRSDKDGSGDGDGSGKNLVRSIAIKAACVLGAILLVRRLTKRTTRREHANTVSNLLCGEKVGSWD